MLCFRRHLVPPYRRENVVSPVEHTPGDFLLCCLSGTRAMLPLLEFGVLDSEYEGGELFWQWPWKSEHGRMKPREAEA